MSLTYQIQKTKPYPFGISLEGNTIHIVISISCKKECGIILNPDTANEIKIPFSKEYSIGNFYSLDIVGVQAEEMTYLLYADEKRFSDIFAFGIKGREKWGKYYDEDHCIHGLLKSSEYDWEGDKPLKIPFHESILYHAHVRGLTKHKSSKVIEKGTFLGACQKLDYLKELGINGVLFMPFYEFDEIIKNPSYMAVDEQVSQFMEEANKTWQYKINYWGFAQSAYYFIPKHSYSYTGNPQKECKDFVKNFHKAGIEVLMQMYFPSTVSQPMIYQVVRFWVEYYHIDGFLLQGSNIPRQMLEQDPLLAHTKLIFESADFSQEINEMDEVDHFKNNGFINYDFMYDSRKYLKGDADMLKCMAVHMRNNPVKSASVNQITSYTGFTLMDLVSYDRKHNEANAESNHDGNDYNYSWNCGFEGPTRKKTVMDLRKKQYKNAISMLFLSQGTPILLSGDEFGNTHHGNNNAYCQDNVMNWINWDLKTRENDLYLFVKNMIQLRKEHPVLHQEKPMRILDYIGCGYPDLSYHSEMAWYADFANYNHHIGILYCGKYARKKRNVEDDFIYILYNMHWMEHDFALPKLPVGDTWKICVDTSIKDNTKDSSIISKEMKKRMPNKQLKVTVPPRSIVVLISSKEEDVDE